MAVKDENFYHPTEGLILSKPRRHFHTSVNPVHWQLRSLIGADKQNIVYFPTGTDNLHVQKLNTITCETETIRVLPFQPRCMVARNGWICCGGDAGEFAAIRVEEDNEASNADLSPAIDPDVRLLYADQLPPEDINLSTTSRSRTNNNGSSSSNNNTHESLLAKSKTFGRELVNCITLWFPPTTTTLKPYEGAYNRPVAVLSNNDKTVALVDLRYQELLDEIPYPDCVNRAVMSPDGRVLIAICDDPYLYVHERRVKPHRSIGTNSSRSGDRPAYEWNPCNKIHLKSQNKEDKSDNRGSFAACFSNTGKYLAVGTQYGTISLFDVSLLTERDGDSLLTSFTSSRPRSELGAVRDMAFAPGPVDLLAWTEDRGRVGVADLRKGFVSRQILCLDNEDLYDHLSISDRSSIDPRLLDDRASDRHDNLASNLASTLDLSRGPGPRSQALAANVEHYNQPLQADETVVLDALQDQHWRRAQRAQARANPSRLAWVGNVRTAAPAPADGSRTRERSASVARAVPDILGNIRDQRDRHREAQERLRAAAGREIIERAATGRESSGLETEADRRRSAVPLPPRPANANELPAGDDSIAARRTLTPRLMGTTHFTPSGGWADLEALYNLSFDNPYENLRSAVDTDVRRREHANHANTLLLMQSRGYVPRESARNPPLTSRPDPHDTAGMAWSEDGQILFVGAEDGIYEFHVNVFNRKLLPSITMR